ncbi:MAG: hypothetical protein K6T83_18990 [Alicyclobacillus sp.]|nr:hypothetical protein [Alicyclobacillus sp.]
MKATDVEASWLRPAEVPFHRRIQDVAGRVHAEQRWGLTDFLTPREAYIATAVARREDLVIATYGGYPYAERIRMLLMPDNWYPQDEDFAVTVLQVSPDGAGGQITHGEVMGSLLGTGVERRKIGDIAVSDGRAHVVTCSDIVPYLLAHWRQVGRRSVAVSPVSASDVIWAEPIYVRDIITVPSLRADAIVAHACHWSRAQSQEAVESGHISLNFTPLTRPDEIVQPGDLLSVRGFGRVKVYEVIGETRKERRRVEVGVLRSNRA